MVEQFTELTMMNSFRTQKSRAGFTLLDGIVWRPRKSGGAYLLGNKEQQTAKAGRYRAGENAGYTTGG